MHLKRSMLNIRIVSIILTLAMLVSALIVPGSALEGEKEEITFATVSDIAYVSLENRGGYNEAFLTDAAANGYQYEQLDGILESVFASLMQRVTEQELKYVIINGAMTYCGEYSNHKALAQMLLRLEEETGVQVIVCPGKNDVNSTSPSSFAFGKRETVTPATASQFKTIYSELGYDLAVNTYNEYDPNSAGLSYSVELDGGYRLIVIDAAYFSYVNGHTSVTGRVSDKLLEWIETECTIAKFAGQTAIGVCSWSLTDNDILGFSDILENADGVANMLADEGMHFFFSAGTGKNDISAIVSDAGNVIYDVQSAPVSGFPNTYRVSTANGDKMSFDVVDADEVKPVVSRKGTEYAKPYRETASLKIQYADYDLAKHFSIIIDNFVKSILIPGVENSTSLESFVRTQYGISPTDYINELIGGGLNIFDIIIIFDASNIMNMLEDVFQQAQSELLEDPDELSALCYKRLKTIFDAQLSNVKCKSFVDSYGFGSNERGGTVNDFVLSMIVYSVCGNEDCSEDAFMLDVVKNFSSGKLVTFFAQMLSEVLIRDLLFNDILSQIEMKPQYLIFMDDTDGTIGYYLQLAFKAYIALHGESSSITGAVNSVIKDGILSEYGKSMDEIIDYYVKYYFAGDDATLIGKQLEEIIKSYIYDEDPEKDGDYDIEYDGSASAVSYASRENFRLPTMITVTPGNDTSTEAYVTWYTKTTVEGTDIEIYSDKNSTFYGKHFIGVDNVAVVTAVNEIERTSSILDLGFITIGESLLQMKQHTMKITGLEPGCTYFLRVGDSMRGWWSDTITVTTATDSETVSFIHVTDTMGRTGSDFDVFENILGCAEYLYPDTDFVLHTGNYVDDSDDLHQWQMLLDGVSEKLMSSYIIPVAGSNDNMDVIKNNFAVGSLLGESEKTGVYYSFDYNFAHIAVLDSTCVNEDGTLTEEQVEWFEKDMEETDAVWKIVAVNKPVYTNGINGKVDEQAAYMQQVYRLIDKHNVDFVFTGSDGVYYRTDAMQGNEVTDNPRLSYPHCMNDSVYYKTIVEPAGAVYSSLGFSGVHSNDRHKLDDISNFFPLSGKYIEPSLPMFTSVEIYGDVAYLTTYTLRGNNATKVDSVSIKKADKDFGDVNYDGKVTAADARLVLRACAQLELITADQQRLADLNGDGKLSAADARLILCMSAGIY